MINILLKDLCLEKNIDLKTLNKETKIALSTLQNLYDDKATSINLSTLDKLVSYFKIRDTNKIIIYINENSSKYDNTKYSENEYE